jgi:dipeptidyl aminopeptidase/acylaminoacyl peptidase
MVHHNQSERFIAALRDRDAEVEAMMIPGAGHHWFTSGDGNPAHRRVEEEPNATLPQYQKF